MGSLGAFIIALGCHAAAAQRNASVRVSVPFEGGARSLAWDRATETRRAACERFAVAQGLCDDDCADVASRLDALVADQTKLRTVSPDLFAAPAWWGAPQSSGTIAFFGGHDASVAVAAADGTLLCARAAERTASPILSFESSDEPSSDAPKRIVRSR